ncbi:MAG: hypothetical protein HY558_06945 [Euryarchaeota archaeon]|nr:hypothetical protein [Euryarchaeota archaeon]
MRGGWLWALAVLLWAGALPALGVSAGAPLVAPVADACIPEPFNLTSVPANATLCQNAEISVSLKNTRGNAAFSGHARINITGPDGLVEQRNTTSIALNLSDSGSPSPITWYTGNITQGNYTIEAAGLGTPTSGNATTCQGTKVSIPLNLSGSACPVAVATQEKNLSAVPPNATVNLTFFDILDEFSARLGIFFTIPLGGSSVQRVTVSNFSTSIPPGISPPPTNMTALYYYQVEPTNISDIDVLGIRMALYVANSTLALFDTSVNAVIGRFNETSQSWEFYDTFQVGGFSGYTIYLTTTDVRGFSLFAGILRSSTPAPTPTPAAPAGPGGGGGGGGAPPPAPVAALPPAPRLTPPPETIVRFSQAPVLVEARPNQTVSLRLVLRGNLPTPLAVSGARVEGLPFPASIVPPDFVLEPGARREVELRFQVPLDAQGMDHRARLLLPSPQGTGETLFLFRVRAYPPSFDKPVVLRRIELDRESGVSRVALEVQNAPREARRVEVVEQIPPELARTPEEVRFAVRPDRILQRAPVQVRYILRDLSPGETRAITYEAPRVLGEYTPYVYFPLKALNVYYTYEPPKLRVEKTQVGPLTPGIPGEAVIELQNLDTRSVELLAGLEAPLRWRVEPLEVRREVPPGQQTFRFALTAPPDSPPGPQVVTFRLSYAAEDLSLDQVVQVQGVNLPLIGGLAAVGVAGSLLVRQRIITQRRTARARSLRELGFRQRMGRGGV